MPEACPQSPHTHRVDALWTLDRPTLARSISAQGHAWSTGHMRAHADSTHADSTQLADAPHRVMPPTYPPHHTLPLS
jgi:hypothetical protein